MKKIVFIFAATLFFSMSFVLTSCGNDDEPTTNNGGSQGGDQGGNQGGSADKAKYTIMFYGCGGGDVDEMLTEAIKDVQKELNVNNNQVRFAVMYSMSKNYAGELGNAGCTYRYELTPKMDISKEGYHKKYFYKNASEVKLYDVSTIVEYINWVKQNVPAENYILMPVNHGGGFDLDHEALSRAIAYDDNQGKRGIPTKAFAEALKQTNTHMKAIYWYGCMMGQLEVLTEVAPYCDFQFASSHVARVEKLHVTSLINGINKSPNNFEQAILEQQKDFKQLFVVAFQIMHENCDFACWRSNKIADINAQVKKLGEILANNYTKGDEMIGINLATMGVYLFQPETPHVDVVDYATNLAEHYSDPNTKETIKTIAADMQKAVDAAYVYRICDNNLKSGASTKSKKFSIGISIYAKTDKTYAVYGKNYKASEFDKATGWSKFLDVNEQSVMIKGALNPTNISEINTDWLDDF